jgi:hypothetical protein
VPWKAFGVRAWVRFLVGHESTPRSASLAHLSSAPPSRTFETFPDHRRLVDLAEVGLLVTVLFNCKDCSNLSPGSADPLHFGSRHRLH